MTAYVIILVNITPIPLPSSHEYCGITKPKLGISSLKIAVQHYYSQGFNLQILLSRLASLIFKVFVNTQCKSRLTQ